MQQEVTVLYMHLWHVGFVQIILVLLYGAMHLIGCIIILKLQLSIHACVRTSGSSSMVQRRSFNLESFFATEQAESNEDGVIGSACPQAANMLDG